jgi:uncharacterized protein (DUF58 family)
VRPAATTALLATGLLAAAALFDAEPLYVPGVAFLLVAGGATAWVTATVRGVTIRRTVGTTLLEEDQPLRVELVVATGTFSLPGGEVEDPLLPGPASLRRRPGGTRIHIDVRFARRGRKVLAPPRVVVHDPLGLATRVVSGPPAVDVLVLPRIEPVLAAPGIPEAAALGALRGRPFLGAEVDLDGLRPYRPGAPASRIAWHVLARRGELLERRLRADSDTRPLVVLDPRAPASEEALDAAVRAAASLVVHLARAGGCALLLPGDRRPSTLDPQLAGWRHTHARLAVVESGEPPALAGLTARRGPVFYVAARSLSRPPRALAHAPGGGRLLVVPGTLPGRRPVFTVAGCCGYEISAASVREVA